MGEDRRRRALSGHLPANLPANLPAEDLSVVIFTSSSPSTPTGTHYAGAIFNEVGRILAPDHAPQYPAAR